MALAVSVLRWKKVWCPMVSEFHPSGASNVCGWLNMLPGLCLPGLDATGLPLTCNYLMRSSCLDGMRYMGRMAPAVHASPASRGL